MLYTASEMISEGSELLLLVPSLAGLVGGVVLPLLGAVPDGAIMLFSGIGDIETAQETLSVGIGALAGSTIMLLTVPWALSVLAGAVNLKQNKVSGEVCADYKDKKDIGSSFTKTGVGISNEIKHAATIMMVTTIPYFLIQVPCSYLEGAGRTDIASGEKKYALIAFIVCIVNFVSYMAIHVKASKEDEQKLKRMEVMKDLLRSGTLSLSGLFQNVIQTYDEKTPSKDGYGSISSGEHQPSAKVIEYLRSVLKVAFEKYDIDGSNTIGMSEFKVFLRDFHENVTENEVNTLFKKYDTDESGYIDYDEFVAACYSIITSTHHSHSSTDAERHIASNVNEEDEDEEDEIPEDIANLSPDDQQRAIKKKAFSMLAVGTFLVLLFSDPMVDVMQEIAVRANISPFYVSFVLAPLASNASEVIASQYYAAKKTSKTITVSFSALLGAAAMNNTFCLSIFMGLIYFRGLAWQYTAETVAIVTVQLLLWFLTRGSFMSKNGGLVVLSIFPLSIVMVYVLEKMGFD